MFSRLFSNNQHMNRTKNRTPDTEEGKFLLNPLIAYLQWAFPHLFCSVYFTLNFSFIFVWRLFSNNQRSNSTKNRTPEIETSTSIAEGKCHSNLLMGYLQWAFLPLFSSDHYLLTFILIVVWNLLFSFSLFLYYDTSIVCINRKFTQHHNTT